MTLTYRSTVGRRLTVSEGDGNISELGSLFNSSATANVSSLNVVGAITGGGLATFGAAFASENLTVGGTAADQSISMSLTGNGTGRKKWVLRNRGDGDNFFVIAQETDSRRYMEFDPTAYKIGLYTATPRNELEVVMSTEARIGITSTFSTGNWWDIGSLSTGNLGFRNVTTATYALTLTKECGVLIGTAVSTSVSTGDLALPNAGELRWVNGAGTNTLSALVLTVNDDLVWGVGFVRMKPNASTNRLHIPVIATASLPAAGAAENGSIVIEDAGVGDRNLIIYAGGERFRIDGGAAF